MKNRRVNREEMDVSDQRKAYEDKCDAQMKVWSAEIGLLSAKADKAAAGAKVEYYQMIGTLQNKHKAAGVKLQELKAASDDAWADLKSGAENAWTELKTAFSSAASKFN